MKIDLPVIPPADIQQGWDGQFQVFSWYNFVLNVPTAVFIVTTQKENGLPNAQLNAWGMLLGAVPYHFGEFYSRQDKRCSGGGGSGFCQLDVKGFDFAK